MSGRVPSSAVAGSSAAGMPRAPTRTSRRVLVGTGELGAWDIADDGHARAKVRIMTGRRTTGTRINLLIRGTSGICHPLRGGREEAERYETCSSNLPKAAATLGMGEERPAKGGKCSEFKDSTGGKYAANLDFLFSSRLYFEHEASGRARGAHTRQRGKGWAMKEFDKKSSPSREGFSKFLPASMSDSSTRRRLTEYEIQVQDLQAYIRSLEAETVHLRKKLEDTPKDFMILENKLREANRQLVQAFNQNEKLVNALYEAREQITALKEEVDKLCAPPSTYGVYLSPNEDGTVNILSQGRKVKVNLHPSLKPETIKPGQELVLNEGLNVVETAGYEIQGDVVILKEQLDPERAVVTLRADEEKVGIIADPLRQARLRTGEHLLMDARSGYLLEKLPKSEVEDLSLEEVPDIGYEQIGGLGT